MAIDDDGNIWSTHNYTYARPTHGQSAPGHILTKLLPDGRDAQHAPFREGGLKGAGFGITIAPNGHVWTGNCAGTTLSEFLPDGTAVSPVSGYQNSNIGKLQGMQSDPCGNIWAANVGAQGSTKVTGFPEASSNTRPPTNRSRRARSRSRQFLHRDAVLHSGLPSTMWPTLCGLPSPTM